MPTFKILKYKHKEGLYGIIQQQQVQVQHIPEILLPEITLNSLVKFVDPFIPEPFKDFELIEIQIP